MKFGSLFSGIGGFDLGLERAGMECAWQVELDFYAGDILRRHWPNVKHLGDVKNVGKTNLDPVDLICGGFPCQDLSVAGRRAGLAGERSGLWFEYHRILEELRPGWCIIENVPGLLSSNKGKDFAVILRGLVELGYGVSWRVLDSQYFGVPQRRRRVFIVGSLGNGRSAEVLFEPEGGEGDSATSGEAGEGIAYALAAGAGGSKFGSGRQGQDTFVAGSLGAAAGKNRNVGQENEADFLVTCFGAKDSSTTQQIVRRSGMPSLGTTKTEVIAFTLPASSRGTGDGHGNAWNSNYVSRPLAHGQTSNHMDASQQTYPGGVRRLTPTECERLQGFPDGWTADQSDSVRYRQLGNAVSVPVIEWIGRRIADCR